MNENHPGAWEPVDREKKKKYKKQRKELSKIWA